MYRSLHPVTVKDKNRWKKLVFTQFIIVTSIKKPVDESFPFKIKSALERKYYNENGNKYNQHMFVKSIRF